MVGDYPVPDTLSWDLFLGVAPDVDVSPDLSPVQLARLGGLGPGRARRHGRAPDRSSGVGPEARPADVDRDDLDAVQRRLLSERDDDVLRVPGARGHAGGEARRGTTAASCRRGRRSSAKRGSNGEGGILYIGSKGKMLQNTYGARPRLLPVERHNSYGAPKEKLARVPHQSHEMNWVNAIKGTDDDLVPVLLRGAPDRDHAARRRVAARRHEAALRRRERCASRTTPARTSSCRACTAPAIRCTTQNGTKVDQRDDRNENLEAAD